MNLDTMADNRTFDHSLALDGLRVENRVLKALLDNITGALPEAPVTRLPNTRRFINRGSLEEKQVFALLAQGHSIRDIAEKLGIPYATTHRVTKRKPV